MNKTMIALVVLLALAGCASAPEASPAASPAADAGADGSAAAPAASAPASESFSDLASVFGMSGSFKCVYRMDDVEQVSQIKDGNMRSDATVEGRETHTIFAGEKVWVWTTEGCFFMDLNEMKALADSMQGGAQTPTPTQDEIAQTALDVKCERASVPDSVFTPPSDCQDMGALFRQMQNYKQ